MLRLAIISWLYQTFVKRIFFLFPPETIHNIMVRFGTLLGKLSVTRWLVRNVLGYQSSDLATTVAGITFPSPVGLSAGFDYNGDLTDITPDLGFGWHTIGTVTWEPYPGNTPPRLVRLKSSQALIVNKGLKNIGATAIIKKLEKKNLRIPTGISIATTNKKFTNEVEQITDMVQTFLAFEKSQVKHSYYELNISCPNTCGGEPFTTPERLEHLLTATDSIKLSRPLFLKMPIDQSDSDTLSLLKACLNHHVDGVIFGNLAKNKDNSALTPQDKQTWQTHQGNVSGKPTWERSNQLVALARKTVGKKMTVIGTGGIFSGADAHTKLNLGADLVQLITGMIFEGPQVIGQINFYLKKNLTK